MGRSTELEQLHAFLQESDRVAIAAAAGMGGIGKTELAWQYAHQHRSDFSGGIWWIAAGVDRVSQILVYAQRMGLLEPPETYDTDRAKVQWCYEQWLKQLPEGRRLLVFDDVAAYGAIWEVLPQDGRFRVLLTTREKLGQPVRRLDLGVLKRSAAFRLLRKLVGDDDRIGAEVGAAKALCAWMGQLPLGIELVGRYLANRSALRLETLLERLEAQRLEARAVREVPAEMPYQANLAAAFELSWQGLSLDAQQVGGLLGGFALAPVAHGWVVASLPEWDEERVEDGLAELERGSLLTVERLLSGENRTGYLLHALIRAFFAAKLETELAAGAEGLRRGMAQAMTEVAMTIPETVVTLRDLARVEGAIPHLAVVAERWTPLLPDSDALWTLTGLARVAAGQSRWQDAEYWNTQYLSVSEHCFGADHPSTATSLNNLALLYRSMGRYSEAEPLYVRSLAIREQQLGADHPSTALSMNNLALLYRSMGRYSEAEPLYVRSLAITEQQLGTDHPHTATSLNNLALLYESMGRYREAEPLYVRSLAIREQQLGADHPDTALSLWNLAALYYNTSRVLEAKPLITRAVDILERTLGDQHPHTVNARTWWQMIHARDITRE
ncbi:tetratricopeptide repeat protein [Egbenema bharatensis]|uniref:tetratricopeptide repeat protein n=1 Tax=Egbenema bharatensis TaxID=3463334 RepID=UPI003A891E9B